jgi:murein DD-endopeptidase MepM/ murein hydrolase activator NlpD
MLSRTLASAMALTLVACAGPRAALPPEPAAAAGHRLADEPLSPPPLLSDDAEAAPATLDGETLRRHLLRFAADSYELRAASLVGDPLPRAQLVRWEEVQTEVERFLAGPTSADDLSAVRALVHSVLDLDGRVYLDLPEPLVSGLGRRLARLDERFAAMTPMGVLPGFRWPLPRVRVTSRFGRRLHPIQGRWRLHTGVDLAAEAGEPVLAAGSGMVVRAGWNAGNGFEVEVQHAGGLLTRYSHLAAPLVLEGTEVQPGDALGIAGRTGTATGVHLHFEFVRAGVARDPLREFRKLVAEPAPRVVILAPQPARRVHPGASTRSDDPGA